MVKMNEVSCNETRKSPDSLPEEPTLNRVGKGDSSGIQTGSRS